MLKPRRALGRGVCGSLFSGLARVVMGSSSGCRRRRGRMTARSAIAERTGRRAAWATCHRFRRGGESVASRAVEPGGEGEPPPGRPAGRVRIEPIPAADVPLEDPPPIGRLREGVLVVAAADRAVRTNRPARSDGRAAGR